MALGLVAFHAYVVAPTEAVLEALRAERSLIHLLVARRLTEDGESILRARFLRRFRRRVEGERGASDVLLGLWQPPAVNPSVHGEAASVGEPDRRIRGEEIDQLAHEAFVGFQREPRSWSRTRQPFDHDVGAPRVSPLSEAQPVPAFEYVVCEDEARTSKQRRVDNRRPSEALEPGWVWFVGWLFTWPGCAVMKFLEDRAHLRGDSLALADLAFRANVRDALSANPDRFARLDGGADPWFARQGWSADKRSFRQPLDRERLASAAAVLDARARASTKTAGRTPFPVMVSDLEQILDGVDQPMRRSELQRVYTLWLLAASASWQGPSEPAAEPAVAPSARLQKAVERWWTALTRREQLWLSARGFGEDGPPVPKHEALRRIDALIEADPSLEQTRPKITLTPQRWGQLEREVLASLRDEFEPEEQPDACRVLGMMIPEWSAFEQQREAAAGPLRLV